MYKGNFCKLLICALSRSVFIANLHSYLVDVSSFVRKKFMFCGISTVIFLVFNSYGVFRLSVSGNATFFPAVQTVCKFGNFAKVFEIYKLYGLDLISV